MQANPTDSRFALLAEQVFVGRRMRSQCAVIVEQRTIRAVAPWAEVPGDLPQRRMGKGQILAPGFIDLQVNGGGCVLFNDRSTAEAMRHIAAAHRRFGTTACLPTFITDSRERMA